MRQNECNREKKEEKDGMRMNVTGKKGEGKANEYVTEKITEGTGEE